MSRLKFGVVGAGHIGKRHMEMIGRNPAFELVAFADIRTPEECGVDSDIPYHETLQDMLQGHQDIDVVCVCTPSKPFERSKRIVMLLSKSPWR
jgi:predicted dehydrogenase